MVTGPRVEQIAPCVVYTEPHPVPLVTYVVPGLYGTKTRANVGTALKPQLPGDELPCGLTQTVSELGLISPVHGKGVNVAVTIGVPDTLTICGRESV